MSITHHSDRIEVSIPVAKALLAFASTDTKRPHLGAGFRDGYLSATDGHSLLSFDAPCRQLAEETGLHWAMIDRIIEGKCWSHGYVETALKVSRATKATTVSLRYADLAPGFPPCTQVIPDYAVSLAEPIKVDPDYLGRILLVCKACKDGGATLTAANGPLEPIMFTVGADRGERNLTARIVIMPMRIDAPAARRARRSR